MTPTVVTGTRRAAQRSGGFAVLAAAVAIATLAGCSHSAASPPPTTRQADPNAAASAVISSLGAVPIPSAAPAEPTPAASPGHPALLAIGGPVRMTLAGGTQALVTALGPEQATLGDGAARPATGPADSTKAIITLRVKTESGSGTVAASELSSRDETGKAITLTPVGPKMAPLSAGATSEVKVAGTFDSGAAQVTWRHAGQVMTVWTFNIELD